MEKYSQNASMKVININCEPFHRHFPIHQGEIFEVVLKFGHNLLTNHHTAPAQLLFFSIRKEKAFSVVVAISCLFEIFSGLRPFE